MTDTDAQNNGQEQDVNVDVNVAVHNAELDPSIPKIYFNELSGVCNQVDNTLLLSRKGVPQAVIYMSIPIAKYLVNEIGRILTQHEQMMEEAKNEQNDEENPEI